MVRPPSARIGPVTPEERKAVIAKSPVKGKYDQTVDSEFAYEVLQKRIGETGRGGCAGPARHQARRKACRRQAAPGGGMLGSIGGIARRRSSAPTGRAASA